MMKPKSASLRKISDNRGMVSADFIFSLTISFGLCVVLFALTLTLSMIEVGQYITYSVSRAFIAAQNDEPTQEAAAQAKFAALKAHPAFTFLFDNNWFAISNLEIRSGVNGYDFSDRYPSVPHRIPQTGIRLTFESKVLNMKIVTLGSTDDGSGNGFKTFLTGLLIREPTTQECQNQMKNDRYKAIQALDPRFANISGASSQNNYVPVEDNGC